MLCHLDNKFAIYDLELLSLSDAGIPRHVTIFDLAGYKTGTLSSVSIYTQDKTQHSSSSYHKISPVNLCTNCSCFIIPHI